MNRSTALRRAEYSIEVQTTVYAATWRRRPRGRRHDVRSPHSSSLSTRREHIEGQAQLGFGTCTAVLAVLRVRGERSTASRRARCRGFRPLESSTTPSVGTTVATSKRPSGSTACLTTHQGCSSTTSLCPSMCTPCPWRWCAGSSLNGFCLVATVASVMYVCSRSLSSKLLMHFRKLGSRR